MSGSDEEATPAKLQKLSSSVTEISSDTLPKLSSSITEISSEADGSFLNGATQKALEDIDGCQNEIDLLNEKASEEILQVEMKYNKLRKPHFEKRSDLIQNIPRFWFTVFVNNPQMANIVDEREEDCLHFLTKLDVREFEDIKSGYILHFHFAPNPYFENDILKKEFHLASADGRPFSRSTKIQWRPNMNLARHALAAKNNKHHRGVWSSFFNWFSENTNPSMDRVAELIKDDLWPNPLQYYLAPDIEVEENGYTDESSEGDDMNNDSIVILGDDEEDDEGDDDDVYEVDDDDDDVGEILEETVESIEVEDDDDEDDDDDAVEIIGSESEDDETGGVTEVSQDLDTSLDAETEDKLLEPSDTEKLDVADSTADILESELESAVDNLEKSQDGSEANKEDEELLKSDTEIEDELLKSESGVLETDSSKVNTEGVGDGSGGGEVSGD